MSSKQTILITGATSGIGRAAALHLAGRGHRVIASGRRQHALDDLAREADSRELRVETLHLDVTDAGSIAAAQRAVDELTCGRGLDVLLNNAGYGLAAPVIEATDEDVRAQFDTNVFGLLAVTRAFVPKMIDRGAGRVINVSSIGGRVTFPIMGVYHASKYALEALSDALRLELSPFGVKVALIEPGPIKTEFTARMHLEADPYQHDGSLYRAIFERAEAIERQTMARAVGPEPVARAIERAVESRRPRARYLAPVAMGWLLAFVNALPTRLSDAIKRAVFRLDGVKRPQTDDKPRLLREAA
jgi:NAD(P)-dependent dehydrogenase (short-subunit alcohol dehydrogenase family)